MKVFACTLGVYTTELDYFRALNGEGMIVGATCSDVAKDISLSPAPVRDIAAVITSVAELGFTRPASEQEIFERASQRGWSICPAEIGFAARLAYRDQPRGDICRLAMNPLKNPRDTHTILVLVSAGVDGRLWLSGYPWRELATHDPVAKFIFVDESA